MSPLNLKNFKKKSTNLYRLLEQHREGGKIKRIRREGTTIINLKE